MDSKPANPLAGPRLWNRVAPDYLREVAPGLALFADDALRLAGVRSGMRVADVCCGPGSLSLAAAEAGARVSALDFSAEMVALLQASARRQGGDGIAAQVGDGMALPWPDAQFDAVFSMFGLIFFPDRARGLGELRRVLRPGGRAVVSSWLPADRVPVMAEIWTLLAAEIPDLPYTRMRPALGDPESFLAELSAAGFESPEITQVTHDLEVPAVLDYWQALQRSTPPLLAVQEAVGDRWAAISATVSRRLEATFGSGPVRVPLMAYLGVGTRPAA